MACKCKAKEKIKEIEDFIPEEYMENDFEEKNTMYYAIMSLNYVLYILKLMFLCLMILLITPFITIYVIWGVITERKVVIRAPKYFNN